MIAIDGSQGEGGGQVLRTALGLSAVTGQPFRIDRIRANRSKPGLARQHLVSVQAAAEVAGASVSGAALGASELTFRPGRVRAGSYRFAIGTAGSTTLVLQTVLPALLMADAPSQVELSGGTHNPMAPPFEFVELAFAPALARMGAGLAVSLQRHGFYPAGGGQLTAVVEPPRPWRPLELLERGAAREPRAQVLLGQLPQHIGRREAAALQQAMPMPADRVQVRDVPSAGPGNAIVVVLPFEHATEVVCAIGERGVTSEQVAAAVAAQARAFLAVDVPVGSHLADQLLVPMALAGGGEFRTVAPSRHTLTNAAVIERFLPVAIELRDDAARPGTWLVQVRPR